MEVTARAAALLCFLASSVLSQPSPPPGELVDLGGYRVHLHCTGRGSPTVMIVGAGFSFDWDLVQPDAAKLTQVCTYDPAGTAWSDPGPGLECSARVSEIHRLLQTARVRGPYLLVGLSIGALVARFYAATYPDETAGIVIADHPYLESPAVRPPTNSPASQFDTPPVLISQAPIVLDADEDLGALPLRDQELHRWAASLHPVQPTIDTARACLSAVEAATSGRSDSLGRLPLAVVSTGNHNAAYVNLQQKLLALSRNRRQVIAERSGHEIELQQPEALVRAIAQVLAELR